MRDLFIAKHKQHHAKPVRKRHIGLLFVGGLILASSAFALGLSLNDSTTQPASAPVSVLLPDLRTASSSLGFSVTHEHEVFSATALVDDEQFRGTQLDTERSYDTLTISPSNDYDDPPTAGSQLQISYGRQLEDFASQAATTDTDVLQVVADLFAPVATNDGTTIDSYGDTAQEKIDGIAFQKNTYKLTTQISSDLPLVETYTIVWSGVLGSKPMVLSLSGLVGGAAIPRPYEPVFESVSLDKSVSALIGSRVEPLGFSLTFGDTQPAVQDLDNKYVSDLVSPAVVKIYSGVCGELTVYGQVISSEPICSSGSGSGFLVSQDGYVATNGHVVVTEAEDLIVDLLVSDSQFLIAFLQAAGLNSNQVADTISSPEALANIIALVYDTPVDTYSLSSEQRKIWVSLGDEPVSYDAQKFFSNTQPDGILEARLIDYDYAAKDVYTTQLSETGEFTASDVALLKIDVTDAPFIELSNSVPLQNEPLTIIGFPGDAENALVAQDKLSVTTTNGVVSSIREATGSDSKLFQSDADASAGNSGGPAINADAQAIGLLTYRFKNNQASDASKSYIRDVADFNALLRTKGITLDTNSSTQAAWLAGLDAFSNNHFERASEEFSLVLDNYPDHRLASSYRDQSLLAIASGRNVQEYPGFVLVGAGLLGGVVLSAGAILMVNHHKKHLSYVTARSA